MKLEIEFISVEANFDYDFLLIILEGANKWIFRLYSIVLYDTERYFASIEMDIEQKDTRNEIITKILDSIEGIKIISLGCENMWNTVYITSSGVNWWERVIYYEKPEFNFLQKTGSKTFLGCMFILLINHDIWKEFFIPIKNEFRSMKWYFYSFENKEQLLKFKNKTLTRNHKSCVTLPFDYSLYFRYNIREWTSDIFPLKISKPTLIIQDERKNDVIFTDLKTTTNYLNNMVELNLSTEYSGHPQPTIYEHEDFLENIDIGIYGEKFLEPSEESLKIADTNIDKLIRIPRNGKSSIPIMGNTTMNKY